MPILRLHRLLMITATAACLALPAAAQPGPGPRGAPTAEMKARHDAARKQHLDDLRTILRLRPDQEPALAAFAAAHQRPGRAPGAAAGKPAAPLTTPERLERMEARHAEMAQRQEARRKAVETFYAALSPDQQKVFDALQRVRGPGAGKGHPGMGMRGRGHPGPGAHRSGR